jgi:hypothetical protein
MISDELVLRCYPKIDDVEEHLKETLYCVRKREPDNVSPIKTALELFFGKKYKEAVDILRSVNYNCVARAIEIHFLEKTENLSKDA